MIKRLILFITALMLAACVETEGLISVRFDLVGVSCGNMTKATTSQIGAALDATAPTGVAALTLQSTTVASRSYTVEVGEYVFIPADTYTVTAEYAITPLGTSPMGKVYAEPTYSVNTEATVLDGKEKYEVAASYTCFALVIDHGETAGYEIGVSGSFVPFDYYAATSGVEVRYVLPDAETIPSCATDIRIIPTNAMDYDIMQRSVRWGGNASVDCVFETGKWYCFSPASIEKIEGQFSIRVPRFGEGWLD